jgi:hypothetical protein
MGVWCALGVFLPWPATTCSAARQQARPRLFNQGLAPINLGRLPAGISSPSRRECELCHVQEAREWEESLHRQSWTQAAFQQAFAREPFQECKNCHQPLTATRRPTLAVADLQREGITCAVCHVRDGAVLASAVSGRAPHPVRKEASLSSPAFCGGCHQFPFPERLDDGRVLATDLPMQDTVGEWERVTAQTPEVGTCQDCHMPWVKGPQQQRHRSHRFLGGYDPNTLQRAVAVTAELRPISAGRVEFALTLKARNVGHAVPTGDLFRRLVITATPVDGNGKSVGPTQQQALARSFYDKVIENGQSLPRLRRLQRTDTRLFPAEPQTLIFTLPLTSQAAAVGYMIRLHRSAPCRDLQATEDADSVSLVAQGQILLPALPVLHKEETP